MTVSETDLWQDAVAIYGRPGVAAGCLRLQDTFGVDIVILLTVLHALSCGLAFDEDDIRRADLSVRPWRRDVVRVLRRVRRQVKDVQTAERGGEPFAALRRSIQDAELDAERIEFGMLDRWLESLSPGPAVLPVRACIVALGRLSFGRRLRVEEERMLGETADAIANAFEAAS